MQFAAAEWLSGNQLLVFNRTTPQAQQDWLQNTSVLRRWRELVESVMARAWLMASTSVPDMRQIAHYDKQIQRLSGELGVTDIFGALGYGTGVRWEPSTDNSARQSPEDGDA